MCPIHCRQGQEPSQKIVMSIYSNEERQSDHSFRDLERSEGRSWTAWIQLGLKGFSKCILTYGSLKQCDLIIVGCILSARGVVLAEEDNIRHPDSSSGPFS